MAGIDCVDDLEAAIGQNWLSAGHMWRSAPSAASYCVVTHASMTAGRPCWHVALPAGRAGLHCYGGGLGGDRWLSCGVGKPPGELARHYHNKIAGAGVPGHQHSYYACDFPTY